MEETASEINFDGIVGPTHNYAGLSVGNLASQKYANQPSNPKQAALEGLEKMRILSGLGMKQAVLPPQERPHIEALRAAGFSGSDGQILERAAKENPMLLAQCGSASAMWAANAATVSPSADCSDGRVHFTPANMPTLFHRSLESAGTAAALKAIFSDETVFAHHPPLGSNLGDEGAANHIRLGSGYGRRSLELFVYGRAANENDGPKRFPARQSREASEAVAAAHGVIPENLQFVLQNPAAIDGGAFHDDVVAVGNLNVLLYHESAFADPVKTIDQIRRWFDTSGSGEFQPIAANESQVSLSDAVASYLFNSQLVGGAGNMAIIAPVEARKNARANHFLDQLVSRNGPIHRVHFVDVRQSMHNGGGPACLRLRVVLTDRELERVKPGVLFNESLYAALKSWIEKHYRDRLTPADLGDVKLLNESRNALDDLTKILGLGSIYRFQGAPV